LQEGTIYLIENQATGQVYIGQTRQYALDMYDEHMNGALDGSLNTQLAIGVRDYGKDNFKLHILEICDIDLLDDREQYWIAYYNTYEDLNHYNSTPGGRANDYIYSQGYGQQQYEAKPEQEFDEKAAVWCCLLPLIILFIITILFGL
jgi:hypothetical protein